MCVCVCMCAHVCVCTHVCMYVCMNVWEREREWGREGEGEHLYIHVYIRYWCICNFHTIKVTYIKDLLFWILTNVYLYILMESPPQLRYRTFLSPQYIPLFLFSINLFTFRNKHCTSFYYNNLDLLVSEFHWMAIVPISVSGFSCSASGFWDSSISMQVPVVFLLNAVYCPIVKIHHK